jgi:mono/diheme cytochrome c family protein
LLWAAGQGRAQTPEPPETTHLIDSLQGPALYRAYCASCHGTDGKGDGPMARVQVDNLARYIEKMQMR